MHISSLELGVVVLAEAVLIALLIWKHAYRTLPTYCLYICWGLLSDVLLFWLQQSISPTAFFHWYVVQLILDSALMFAVLVELTWNLLRPIRSSLPKHSWVFLAALIGLAGLLLWPVAGYTLPQHLSTAGASFFRLQQTIAILRVVIFIAIAGFSHLLSIGWRDRELQLATGFGLYSLVSLAATVLHAHQIVGVQYHWLDETVALSYAGVLIYWIVSFATKEAERREFTPQMRGFLLAAAGAARATRFTMMESRSIVARQESPLTASSPPRTWQFPRQRASLTLQSAAARSSVLWPE